MTGPDTPALPHLPPRLPDLSGLSFGGGDLGEHFRRVEDFTRRRTERAAPSTVLLPDFVTLAAEDSLLLDDDGEDLLQDARANIADGEYAIALEQLAEFLEISPGHPETRYLQAYCHYRLGDLTTALEITRPMRREKLEPQLRHGVLELRRTLCDVLTPQETHAFLDNRHRDPRAADERFGRFIELAPEESEPPYLLAIMQAMDGDYTSAYRTARSAVDVAEGDTSQLRTLADALRTAALRPLTRDAVHALADGAYQRTRKALRRLDREWREAEVVRDFDAYVEGLLRTGHSPAHPLPPPKLSPERATRLYALIADQYREEATDLVADQRWAEAERVLAKILHLVPSFPPPNYLYAICLLMQGKDPERAITAAGIAARDPLLPAADALLRKAVEAKEVFAINAAFDEHNAAMAKVDNPPTWAQLITLRRTMEELHGRMPGLQAMASTRENTRQVQKLADAVTQRLTQIDHAMAHVEVNALVLRFNRWAEQLGSARPGLADFAELRDISREAGRLLGTTTDQRSRQILQDILTAVNRFV
jgi:tetratricopeptide (TPR) repeat protein